jgi:hypothetical protein
MQPSNLAAIAIDHGLLGVSMSNKRSATPSSQVLCQTDYSRAYRFRGRAKSSNAVTRTTLIVQPGGATSYEELGWRHPLHGYFMHTRKTKY